MKSRDVVECSFSEWYKKFKHLTIESDIIDLTQDFVDYLLCDSIILPKSCDGDLKMSLEDESLIQRPSFPELEAQIKASIDRFKFVFPKLNWSSCNDAEFMNGTRSKCDCLSEILVLLKSSDKIMFDLTEPFKHCDDSVPEISIKPQLILRKWININPSTEFRVFVACDQIIGISQRDVRSFYEFLGKDKENLEQLIHEFFENKIQNNFCLLDFVMDVYIDEKENVYLLDMNPFGEMTDSLLFDWDELEKIRLSLDPGKNEDISSDFRYIQNSMGIQNQRFFMNSFPIDAVNGNIDALKLVESAYREQISSDDDDDENNEG